MNPVVEFFNVGRMLWLSCVGAKQIVIIIDVMVLFLFDSVKQLGLFVDDGIPFENIQRATSDVNEVKPV